MGTKHDQMVDEEIKKNLELARFERLPKWAQDELRQLDRKVDYLEQHLKSLQSNADTNVHYQSELSTEIGYNHPLPVNARLEFRLVGKAGYRPRIRVNTDDNGRVLKINADTGITITPEAGNAVMIQIREY